MSYKSKCLEKNKRIFDLYIEFLMPCLKNFLTALSSRNYFVFLQIIFQIKKS